MATFIYRLVPGGPMHFGLEGEQEERISEILHSDTIFSAICTSYLQLFGKDELQKFISDAANQNSPDNITLTSGFPFWKDGSESVYCVPTPVEVHEKILEKYGKKKLPPYIDVKDIEKGIDGTYQMEVKTDCREFVKTQMRTSTVEERRQRTLEEFVKTQMRTRVVLNRDMSATPFYCAQLCFDTERAGLYFLLKANDTQQTKIEACLKLLSDCGMGGERSYGLGSFKIEKDETPAEFKDLCAFPENPSGKYYLTSLCGVSAKDRERLRETSFKTVFRGGHSTDSANGNQARRKGVLMLREGAVSALPAKGEVFNVSPEGFTHEVYRYAVGAWLPIGSGGK